METNHSFDLLDEIQDKSHERVSPSLASSSSYNENDYSLYQDDRSEIDQSKIQVFDPQTNQQDRMIKQPSLLMQQRKLSDLIKQQNINKQSKKQNYSNENCDDQSALGINPINNTNLLTIESSLSSDFTTFQGQILTDSMIKQQSYSDSCQIKRQTHNSMIVSNSQIELPRKRWKWSVDQTSFINSDENSVSDINCNDYLSGCDYQSFIARIDSNKDKKVVNLNKINLGDNLWIYHFQSASRDDNLEQIYLGYNNITSEGFKELGKHLQKFPSLRQIHLNNNQIKHGLKQLAQNADKSFNLRTINLSGNQIIDQSISQFGIFSENLKNLQTIQLGNNLITAQGLSEFVARAGSFPNLHTICLQYNKISGEGLAALAINSNKFPKLKIINLEHNEISDVGLKALAYHGGKLPNLQKILLQNNKITSDGLVPIAVNSHKFSSLRTLKLDYNQITDEGLIKFAEEGDKFLNMTQFSFNYNKITQNGVKQLNKHVCKFPDVPKQYFKINLTYKKEKWFISQLILQIIFIIIHYSVYQSLQPYRQMYQSNQVFSYQFEELISYSGTFPNLRILQLRYVFKDCLFTQFMQNSHKYPNLEHLELDNNQLTDENLIMLLSYQKNFLNLKYLDLKCNKITDTSFRKFLYSKIFSKTVVNISFAQNKLITIPDYQILPTDITDQPKKLYSNMFMLELQRNQINDTGLVALLEKGWYFANLSKIDLSYNNITGENLKFQTFGRKITYVPLSKLQILNLKYNKITNLGLYYLAKHANKFPNLKILVLQFNLISDQGLRFIAESQFVKFKNLKQIYLAGNKNITSQGLKCLKNKQIFPNLTVINISINKQYYDPEKKFH